jgi:hypothetical protein
MGVQIDEPAYGVKTKGIVDYVEQTPGTHGLDGYHFYFAVRVEETSARLDGFSLRLTIPVVSTKGMVLAVPISAVSLGADGVTRVTMENDGRLATVMVEPGLAANGYVEISSRDEGLRPGRLVVVGHESPQMSTAATRQEPRLDVRGFLEGARNAFDTAYSLIVSALEDVDRGLKGGVDTQ